VCSTVIDLRSDTVTVPTPGMREAMASAEVGDDVYGGDPTVKRLEARVAELLGKEDAVYVPSGTMSNQIAFRVHTEPGDMAIMDGSAHMVINEGGGGAAHSGVTVWRVRGSVGVFGADDLDEAIEVPHPFNPPNHPPRPRLVCVEQTHNQSGGIVWPLDALRSVADAAHDLGLATHMDGARLWHASAASGVPESTYAESFDTVSVCFSKGLGAPVGSALVGSRELVARGRRFKQMFGGGFRQAGVIAAGALYALEHHRERLAEDVARARRFAERLWKLPGVSFDLATVQSNIVRFEVTSMTAGAFVDGCHARGVHLLPGGHHGVRAVMHQDISDSESDQAVEVIQEVLGAP
jgi:threonine aldolase